MGTNISLSLHESLWTELKHYLTIEMEVGQPKSVASNLACPGGMAAPVRIRLSNTAPAGTEHPRIVFTGISVLVRTTEGLDSIEWARQRQPTKEVSDRPAKEEMPDNHQSYLAHLFVGSEFPESTPVNSNGETIYSLASRLSTPSTFQSFMFHS